MHARRIAAVGLLLVGGCLVPRYDYEPSGGSGGAGNSSGNPANAGSAGSATAGAGTNVGGSSEAPSCTAQQKPCAGECVERDDPAYGCGPSACDALACPVAGDGTLACEGELCVIGACGAGSKKCDGKCVAIDDPTYGCSEQGCDPSACPDPGSGTVVCDAGTCRLGECTENTKACDRKCVPLDRNNGCSAASCEPCDATEQCGEPSTVGCECVPVDACTGRECGETTGRCGEEQDCGQCFDSAKPLCDDGKCVQCIAASDCPTSANVCAPYRCADGRCEHTSADLNTPCPGGGTCKNGAIGLCVRPPITVGNFDIDATEVTRGHYRQFLDAVGDELPQGLPPGCAYKDSFSTRTTADDPSYEQYDLPMTSVDWCDAWAYCNHIGRRLCGKIGGGPTPRADWQDPAVSQWMKACGGPSNDAFPYGDTYMAGYCHDSTALPEDPAVASYPMCEGGYDGLFDMSGSALEWEDSCDGTTGRNDFCAIRGGGYLSVGGAFLSCGDSSVYQRYTRSGTGIRCCSK